MDRPSTNGETLTIANTLSTQVAWPTVLN